ncbi:MAG: nuclear transport factor 2 family protein [Leuconostoc pseudomesenteroides]
MTEKIIDEYFEMWVKRDFAQLQRIFSSNITYHECTGAMYIGMIELKAWIKASLQKQTVLMWQIKNIQQIDDQTFFVEWFFKARETQNYCFDGVSKIQFDNHKIIAIDEYAAKHNIYRPYQN